MVTITKAHVYYGVATCGSFPECNKNSLIRPGRWTNAGASPFLTGGSCAFEYLGLRPDGKLDMLDGGYTENERTLLLKPGEILHVWGSAQCPAWVWQGSN
jgi:hypothetical protein